MAKRNAKDLLEDIVEMMDEDLQGMQEREETALDARSAAKITRYSKALLEILDYESSVRKEQKAKLATLTEEELKARLKKALKEEQE